MLGAWAALLLLAIPLPTLRSADAPADAVSFRESIEFKPEERPVLEAFIGHAKAFAAKQTPELVAEKCAKSPESFAWVDFPYLNCLNISYELTGDSRYLDILRDTFQLYRNLMSTSGDEFLGWYGSPIPPRIPKDNPDIQIDEIQMTFRAIALLSRWVQHARENPEYAHANAATIDAYLALMKDHLYPKWDQRGHYAHLPNRGGVYRGLDYPIPGGTSLSHEKLSIMFTGLWELYRVTGDDTYLHRALEIGAWFRSALTLKDGHYEWMSWEPAGPWDVSPDKPDAWKVGWIAPDPNAAWYVAALSTALTLYQSGLMFTEEDLARFVKTQKEMCWDVNMENPTYRTVAGATGKYVKGRFLSNQLANYDPTLSKLAFFGPHEAETLANTASDWKGGANASGYVVQKFLVRPMVTKSPQPFAEVGRQFLAKPENKKFYDDLMASLPEVGTHTCPLKPSEAAFLKK